MRIPVSAALAAAMLSNPAAAQDAPLTFLGRIIAAAGLSPAPEAAYGRQVTVVTGEELEARGGAQLVEALRGTPGVAVSRTGGPAGITNIRIRGAEARHTLVMIDGVVMNTALEGVFDFAGLDAADIERVEILRGPQSSFFGSNTIGGVVSITTRRAAEPGFSGLATVEGGSDTTIGGSLNLSHRGERGGFSLTGVVRNDGGHDVSGSNGERDGNRNRTLSFGADYQLTEDWQIGLLLRWQHDVSHYDDAGAPVSFENYLIDSPYFYGDRTNRLAMIYARGELWDGRARITARLSHTRQDALNFSPSWSGPGAAEDMDHTGTRTEASIRGVVALDGAQVDAARHTLALGVDRMRETFRHNNPAYTWGVADALVLRERNRTGVALEYRGAFASGFDVQLAARRDINEGTRDATTWSAALSYRIEGTGTRLMASAGAGIQYPSHLQQFGWSNTYAGNPDLRPERSRGWDIGIEQSFAGGRATATAAYFDNAIFDAIGSTSAGGVTSPINLTGTSRSRGVELSLRAEVTERVSLHGSYTWNETRDPSGNQLVRRPLHALALGAEWRLDDRWTLAGQIHHQSGAVDQASLFDPAPAPWGTWRSERANLPSFTRVDVSVSYRLNERVDVYARVNNLFDARYQEVLGYRAQGRTAYVGLRARF